MGITTSYVGMNASNTAYIDTTGATVEADGSVDVFAGREDDRNTIHTEATAVAGAVGGTAVNLNAAVADNNAYNSAQLRGNGRLKTASKLAIGANALADSVATIYGVTVGVTSVAASVAVSLLRSTQEAKITGSNIEATGLDVISNLNADADEAPARAELYVGSGGLISAAANVAVAYGRSKSVANAAPTSVTITGNGDVKVGSYGIGNVLSKTGNMTAAC